MHPFPPTAELQFLLGEEIAQICLDPYALQFRFAKGGHISVEGRIVRRSLKPRFICTSFFNAALLE
jgi:hypothetical protein